MLFCWLWKRSLLIGQWHGQPWNEHFIISQAVMNENTRIFLHKLGKQCCFQYCLRSASALSPIENKLETHRNHEQWKTALTRLTKQHLWNKHFLTVSCWLKWTSARPRCTAGNLEPLSRDLFAISVRQVTAGSRGGSRFRPDSCEKKNLASTPTDVWIYFCLHTQSVLHESAHMELCSQKQI